MILNSGRQINSQNLSEDEVIVYPEILEQFDLKIGDNFSIGSSIFKIVDVVEKIQVRYLRWVPWRQKYFCPSRE